MQKKRWTKKEERDLLKLVEKNSQNLSYCFTLFAESHPERTESAANFHYYTYLRNKYKEDPKKSKFILGDKEKLMPMTKNVARAKEVNGIYLDTQKIKSILMAIVNALD